MFYRFSLKGKYLDRKIYFSKYMYSSCIIFKHVVPQRYMENIDEIRKMISFLHYSEVVMGAIAFQITSLAIVYLMVYSGADQRKHQSSASLIFVWGIHRWPMNSPHKWPVTRQMFPFDDVIMKFGLYTAWSHFLETPGFRLQPFREISHGWSWRQELSYASVTSNYRLCTFPHHCLCFWSVSAAGPWWRHQMETFSALLGFCAGNSPVTGEFPAQRPDTRSFDVFFHLHPCNNGWVNNREAGDLRRPRAHYDVIVMSASRWAPICSIKPANSCGPFY